MKRPQWRVSAPFIRIGHRGLKAKAPENTLLGLDTGIRSGAQALEFDVQQHPSGELFLLHDLLLNRTTSGRGPAAALPWEQLRALDAGQGERIPTLDEALKTVARRVPVNIELKTWNGTAAAVAQVLRRQLAQGWAADDFVVSSFHHPELAEFRRLMPEIPVATLYLGVALNGFEAATSLNACAVCLGDEFADADLIAQARQQNLATFVYTVNDANEKARWEKLGAAGVFTDSL